MPASSLQGKQDRYKGHSLLCYEFCTNTYSFATVPIAVSLVENECDSSTNILSVTYEPLEGGQQKQEIAVCVKVRIILHLH